ncbi:hypothetical protein ACFYVR_13370 [Rhodococcus sp. NPDC003318]|uniref:hypothetical protein n=1 Tax=Rhodococcus sp. NPDC003318 TaxID=3364503 RepID=UPI0036927BCD
MAVWILLLLAWLAISVVAALTLGAMIRLRDRKESPSDTVEPPVQDRQPRRETGA